MRIHILGIGGTFMAGLALLAKQKGYEVTGSDVNIYPPMSTQLAEQGIVIFAGYQPEYIDPTVDYVIVGNVISRGNPALEYVLNAEIPYISGPQWLAEYILKGRHVLAVAGTHGKTTTTSLLIWILETAGLKPGFLVGGIPGNFGFSARVGESDFFVVEADEYDSAFCDKRSKFVHYHPKTLILNNLEFDHADIFSDLAAITQQFHYLVRTVPANACIIRLAKDHNLTQLLAKGCWTPVVTFGDQGEWQAKLLTSDGSVFEVYYQGKPYGTARWELLGQHNVHNALAAMAAAFHVGVSIEESLAALTSFQNVKRRLEIKGKVNDIVLYDDFAHHPTAIATTLAGLRAKLGAERRIVAVLELGSYTMRSGVHKNQMNAALAEADVVFCQRPTGENWGLAAVLEGFAQPTVLVDSVDSLVKEIAKEVRAGDHVVVMSNTGFGGIHDKLLRVIPFIKNNFINP